ncbi:DUF748 domain-containing protein [Vibrio sp. JC009]|uniref:DUF748 domain-containing protein n=1 Tax=Vibrio sp. JC009 TaxID=2912314 RepID=UPI0023B18924|nr:DUF748 domain-containing protein [Vibrio sp. JC009]WED21495.1 DUF748 domain-containing protein [Vibrio sp. JC009]
MKTTVARLISRFKSAPRIVRISSYLVMTYAFYAIIVGLALPAAIQSQAPKKLTELTGREVRIEKVAINPFILRVRVDGFSIAEQKQANSFVSLKQLELEINFWQSIFALAPVIDHLTLSQPDISIARLSTSDSETLFNFSSILNHMAKQQAENPDQDSQAAQETSAEVFPLIAHSIEIQQASFNFSDNITGARLGYKNIGFTLNNLSTREFTLSTPELQQSSANPPVLNSSANLYTLAITGADQSQLNLEGQFQLQPVEAKGKLNLTGVQLAPFWPLSDNLIKAELNKGEVNFATEYHLKQAGELFNFSSEKGHFSLSGLEFVHNDTPKVKTEKLEVNDIELSSSEKNVNVAGIKLSDLWADAKLSDNGVDLADLFTPKAGPSTQAAAAEPEADKADEEAWLVKLNAFEMANTDIHLKEQFVSQGVHWRIYPLNISTGKVISDLSQPLDYKLDLGVSSDTSQKPQQQLGQFSSQGKLDASNQSADGSIKLTKLDLKQFQPYLDPHLNLILDSGTTSTEGNFSANSKGKATYNGRASIDNLLIKDTLKNEPLVKWQAMSVNSVKFDQQGNSLDIDTITFNQPYAKVLIAEDKRTNIGEVVKSEPAASENSPEQNEAAVTDSETTAKAEPEQSAGNESGLAMNINKIEIVNGSAFFSDEALKPNFASGIHNLEGYIKQLSSTPGTTAEVDLKGKIDKYAPISLTGEVNPLVQPPYLDLDFKLDSAELTSVNPYSGTYAGYYIDKGQLSLDIKYRLEQNQLEGKNHILVDQLQLGKRSESELATSLPVSLAIALLQDRNGVIDLGFEVAGDTENPEFSIGGIVAKAIVNIITKAVTAPFSLLSNLVGSEEELNFIEFDPGIATLNSAGENRLEKLAKALQSRPQLRVNVEGSVLPADDSRALAEMSLQKKLLTESGLTELPEDLTASRIPQSGPLTLALEKLFTQELKQDLAAERAKAEQKVLESTEAGAEIDQEQVTTLLNIGMYNQLLNAQEISEHDLGSLAETRAQAVKAFLVGNEIEPGRIFILDSKTELKKEQSQALLTLDAG